jgi:hypothetical protein
MSTQGEKVSEKDQEKLFEAILSKAYNQQCADCNAKVINISVFFIKKLFSLYNEL